MDEKTNFAKAFLSSNLNQAVKGEVHKHKDPPAMKRAKAQVSAFLRNKKEERYEERL